MVHVGACQKIGIGKRSLVSPLFAGLLAFGTILPISANPGDRHYFHSNYIEYIEGDLPFIISASHGGSLLPAEMPNRVSDTAKAVPDQNTEELAREILAQVFKASGHFPHVIINRIHRMKLDPNRGPLDTLELPYGNDSGRAAWTAYHAFIDTAMKKVKAAAGTGIYIDLHGHQHALPRVELGYLISNYQLGQPDSVLAKYAAASSMQYIASRTTSAFPALIRGAQSFGGYLQARNIAAVPSPGIPDNDTNAFFSGGYTLKRHCSAKLDSLSGFQMELPLAGFRDSQATRAAFASVFLGVIRDYVKLHLGLELPNMGSGIKAPKSKSPIKRRGAGSGDWASIDGKKTGAGDSRPRPMGIYLRWP